MAMFPDAPVYTLLYDKTKTLGRFEGRIRKTSFLDFPFVRRHHRLFLPLMPLAARSLDLGGEFDLIISDSAGYGKGVRYDHEKTIHISYCHTPLRYAWETKTYVTLKYPRIGWLVNLIVSPVAWYLRRWDKKAASRTDVLIANSKFIAGKIKAYYGREASVIYPPVDTSKFYLDPSVNSSSFKVRGYYLAVGRLLHYKRFDLVIDAFRKLGLPLKIVGDGPERDYLKARARGASNIDFISFIDSEDELRRLYSKAAALIFPHVEDFGLVAAESQACGTPIVEGGAMEIVADGVSGVFFNEPTAESLSAAVERCSRQTLDRRLVSEAGKRFSVEAFKKGIQAAVKEALARKSS